jgi:hypothetical protein
MKPKATPLGMTGMCQLSEVRTSFSRSRIGSLARTDAVSLAGPDGIRHGALLATLRPSVDHYPTLRALALSVLLPVRDDA